VHVSQDFPAQARHGDADCKGFFYNSHVDTPSLLQVQSGESPTVSTCSTQENKHLGWLSGGRSGTVPRGSAHFLLEKLAQSKAVALTGPPTGGDTAAA